MGWDGYAHGAKGGRLPPAVSVKFKKAAELVREVIGTVDHMLELGGLDCSDCAAALTDMTGVSWFEDYTSAEVRKHWERAKDNTGSTAPAWAYASARMFLKICAENNCSFHASY